MGGSADFLYELGHLKLVRRSGWWIAGVRDPESVADHSFRTAIVGYLLAHLTGADSLRVLPMCLFHDIHETRIHDVPRMAKQYVTVSGAANDIVGDQTRALPSEMAKELRDLVLEFSMGETLESVVARDADRLECLLQAREYQVQGYAHAEAWIVTSLEDLRTDEARRLAEECIREDPKAWWLRLMGVTLAGLGTEDRG